MSVNLRPTQLPGKQNLPPQAPAANDPRPPRPNSPGANSPGANLPENPASRPNTPGPVEPPKVNTTGKKSATKYLENVKCEDEYIQKLQKEAQEAWKTHGPLCDSEGFYQHTGECWNDAIQQILCNADKIKEYVQYVYVFWNFDTENYKTMPDWYFVPTHLRYDSIQEYFISTNKEWIEELKKWMNLYFRESQKRFLRHYLLETKRRTLKKELCAVEGPELGELAREKIRAISKLPEFRKGGVEAQQSAIYGKYTNIELNRLSKKEGANFMLKPTREEYIAKNLAGGSDTDEEYIFNIYSSAFFRNELKVSTMHLGEIRMASLDIPAFKTFLDSVTGIHFGISKTDTDKTGKLKRSGHALAFYQCGNQELFYEDNYGIFPFEWRQFILKYLELLKTYEDAKMEFTAVSLKNKAQDIYFYTSFCPVLTYSTNEGVFHVLLALGDSFIETNLESKEKFIFHTTIEGTEVKLNYNSMKAWQFTRFMYLQSSPSQYVANTAFELNSLSRIELNPIIQAIIHKDEEDALDAIDAKKVEPALSYRKEGEGNIPAILLAIRMGLPKVAMKLIEKGYDTKARNPNGETSLLKAIIYEFPDVVQALIRKDPSLMSIPDEYGKEPLSFAVFEEDFLPSTKILVEAGADIESRSTLGRTALFFASREGSIETVKYLCSKGANPLARDNGRPESNEPPRTPLDVAKTPEIREILEKQCGKTGGRRRRRKTRKVQRKRVGKKTRRQ